MLFTWWRQAGRGPKHPSAPVISWMEAEEAEKEEEAEAEEEEEEDEEEDRRKRRNLQEIKQPHLEEWGTLRKPQNLLIFITLLEHH